MCALPVKIGSFNMCKFSNQSDGEVRKNLDKIVEIIRRENFDILAMQEVFNKGAAEQLSRLLGTDWTYAWEAPKSNYRSAQISEGYAYFWKKSRFQLATGRRSKDDTSPGAGRVFDPRIHRQYPRDPILMDGRLARDPFYIRLESLQGWYEIRLINTHIIFSGPQKTDGGIAVSASDAGKRQRELEALINIYCKISDKAYRSCRPFYTFLLGDYNLNLNRPWTTPPYLQETVEKLENGHLLKRIVTKQDQLTTLKARSPKEPDKPARDFSNNYDHFTFDELRFEGMQLPVCTRIDTVYGYCNNDFELHRKEISDHVPICLTFSFT